MVADMNPREHVAEALSILDLSRARLPGCWSKVLGSAVATATTNDKADADALG